VIDAQSGECIPEIFPEGVDPLARVQRPQRVGPALLHKAAIGIAHLRPKQGVIDQALRRALSRQLYEHALEPRLAKRMPLRRHLATLR
jgi:hypothetical protein